LRPRFEKSRFLLEGRSPNPPHVIHDLPSTPDLACQNIVVQILPVKIFLGRKSRAIVWRPVRFPRRVFNGKKSEVAGLGNDDGDRRSPPSGGPALCTSLPRGWVGAAAPSCSAYSSQWCCNLQLASGAACNWRRLREGVRDPGCTEHATWSGVRRTGRRGGNPTPQAPSPKP